jgi:alkylhydroperoxidase family enzyme
VTAAGLAPPGGWIETEPVRLEPLARGGAPLLRLLSWTAHRFRQQETPRLFALMGRHRRLFWPWLWFASRLMPYGELDPVVRETLILRTAWICRSRYEWGQHVEIGRRAGVTAELLARIARGPESCADPDERALLAACDELVVDHCVGAETWSALSRRFDERALIEIALVVGHYQMLAGFLNSAGLPLEESAARRLEELECPDAK